MATNRKKSKPPTRAETDAEVDRRLAKAAAWIDVDDLDQIAVELHKETYYEYAVLRHLVRTDPIRKTPAIAERLDQLRRDLQQQNTEFGLTPSARKGLGLPAAVRPQNVRGVTTYRNPPDHRAFRRKLVETGVWDAVGAGIKAELAAEKDNTTTERNSRNGKKDSTPEVTE